MGAEGAGMTGIQGRVSFVGKQERNGVSMKDEGAHSNCGHEELWQKRGGFSPHPWKTGKKELV